MKEQLLEQLKIVYEILADDNFTDAVATYCWKLYTKLKEKGFTDEQAIKIVTQMSRSDNSK